MGELRHKNRNWNLYPSQIDGTLSLDRVQVAVLMDIRDELQTLNRLLSCQAFIAIPRKLDVISERVKPSARCRKAHKHG